MLGFYARGMLDKPGKYCVNDLVYVPHVDALGYIAEKNAQGNDIHDVYCFRYKQRLYCQEDKIVFVERPYPKSEKNSDRLKYPESQEDVEQFWMNVYPTCESETVTLLRSVFRDTWLGLQMVKKVRELPQWEGDTQYAKGYNAMLGIMRDILLEESV